MPKYPPPPTVGGHCRCGLRKARNPFNGIVACAHCDNPCLIPPGLCGNCDRYNRSTR